MSEKRQWKVGDRYTVIQDGRRLLGTIYKIDWEGYHVEWSNGEFTVEDVPSPAQDKFAKAQQ